jgi:hypothetical protein
METAEAIPPTFFGDTIKEIVTKFNNAVTTASTDIC